jgi:signal transduction histidine kinase
VIWAGAALIVLVQLAIAVVSLTRSRDSALADARRVTEVTARATESAINRAFLQVDAALLGIGGLMELVPPATQDDGPIVRRLLRETSQQNFLIRDLAIYSDSRQLVNAATLGAARTPTELVRSLIDTVIANPGQGLQFGEPRRNRQSGDWGLLVARELRLRGGDVGVVIADVPLFELADLFVQSTGVPGLGIALMRATGELMIATPHDEPRMGQTILDPAARARVSGVADIERDPATGAERIVARRVVSYRPLIVEVAIDIPDVLQSWRDDLWAIGIGSFGFTVLVLVLAQVIGLLLAQRAENERALIAARDAAERANRAKSGFLANMSHELRTPLNAIIGFAEIINTKAFGEQALDRYVDYAGDIQSSGQHLLDLINDILDLSKVEAGAYEVVVEPIDLPEFVNGALGLFRSQVRKGGIELACHVSPGLGLSSDTRALRHIVVNLLSNAIKFTPTGGGVSVTATLGEDGVVSLSVADTGIGMTKQQLDKVFEPFQQADALISRRFGGTGLGLAIVRSYVSLLGADIAIHSNPGVGTTVTVTFPPLTSATRFEESAPQPNR